MFPEQKLKREMNKKQIITWKETHLNLKKVSAESETKELYEGKLVMFYLFCFVILQVLFLEPSPIVLKFLLTFVFKILL